eukprot:tig00021105_g18248.t1
MQEEGEERRAKRSRLADDPTPPPEDDWRAVFSASAVVPVNAEGVRAFTEADVFSRSEALLAAACAASRDARRAMDELQLELAIQHDTAAAAASAGDGPQRALRLAARFRARGSDADGRDIVVHASLRAPAWATPSPAEGANQLGEGLAGRAVAAGLGAFRRTRKPMWRCNVAGCSDNRRFPFESRGVLETSVPHTALYEGGCGWGSDHGMPRALEPVKDAPESVVPLYYSLACGHQVYPEDQIEDGGDSECFDALVARLRAFSEQLRAAGHLLPSAAVLLQFAASLAAFKGDPTFLWRYEIDVEREAPVHSMSPAVVAVQHRAQASADHTERSASGLCLVAVDERLDAQQRGLLASAALDIADSYGLQRDRTRAGAEEFESRLLDDPSLHRFRWSPYNKSITLEKTRRALLRAARLARTPWGRPHTMAMAALSRSEDIDGEATSPNASVELLSLEPPLDLEIRCRYLLERGCVRECLNLSRTACVASTLAAAAQALSGRPEDAVSALLEIVDGLLPRLFDAAAALFDDAVPSKLQWACECGARDRGQAAASTLQGIAHLHSPSCFWKRCQRVVNDYNASTCLHARGDHRQREWLVALQRSIVETGRAIENLRRQRVAACDHLSSLALSLALVPLDKFYRHLRESSDVREADVFHLTIRSGLALRSALPSPPPSVERESTEALRVAGLPLAEAFAACRERPDVALEAALIRLARMGALPRAEEDGGARLPLRRRQGWCAPLRDAGLELGVLAARFYLKNTNLDKVCSDSGGYDKADPQPFDSYLGRIGDALFGPVSTDPAAMASPARVLEVAASLLAARQGTALSELGESEPASAQQYETLMIACVLRLYTLHNYDDALRLLAVLLEMVVESGDADAGASERKKLCLNLVVKGPAATPFRSSRRYADIDLNAVLEELTTRSGSLIVVASEDAVRAFLNSVEAIGNGAPGLRGGVDHEPPASLHLKLAECLLLTRLAAHGGPVLCERENFIGDAGKEESVSRAAQTLLAASRRDDGSLACASAGFVLRALSRFGSSTLIDQTCSCADQYLRFAILLKANGDVESAAAFVFSAMLSSSQYEYKHFEFALRFFDEAAPLLAEQWGIDVPPDNNGAGAGPAATWLRRRIFGRFLQRFKDIAPAPKPYSDRREPSDPWGPFMSLAAKFAGAEFRYVNFFTQEREPYPLDIFLAAKFGVAAFSSARARQYFSRKFDLASVAFWRAVLGEIHVRLQSAAGGAEEEDRADALRLAELVWEACPCVQAVWVIRDVLTADGDGAGDEGEGTGSGASYAAWLQARLDELKRNFHLVLAGDLEWSSARPTKHECTWGQGSRKNEQDSVSEESRRVARLVLAAGALLLSDEEDESLERVGVETALRLDLTSRQEGFVPLVMVLARWARLAEYARFSLDDPREGSIDHDAATNDWHGTRTADMEVPVVCFSQYALKAIRAPHTDLLQLAELFKNGGRPSYVPAPDAAEDGYSVEELESLGEQIIRHQFLHECDEPNCRVCPRVWFRPDHMRSDRRLYSLGLLGGPLARLLIETVLRFPWGAATDELDDCRGSLAYEVAGVYAEIKARSTAVVVGLRLEGISCFLPSEAERESLVQSVQKAYIAARTVTEELRISYQLLGLDAIAFDDYVTPAIRELKLPLTRRACPAQKCVERGFARFPNVVGALDGSHIPINVPPGTDESAYYCHKGFHSVILLAICDSVGRFLWTDVGEVGRHSDWGPLRNTSLIQNFAACGTLPKA